MIHIDEISLELIEDRRQHYIGLVVLVVENDPIWSLWQTLVCVTQPHGLHYGWKLDSSGGYPFTGQKSISLLHLRLLVGMQSMIVMHIGVAKPYTFREDNILTPHVSSGCWMKNWRYKESKRREKSAALEWEILIKMPLPWSLTASWFSVQLSFPVLGLCIVRFQATHNVSTQSTLISLLTKGLWLEQKQKCYWSYIYDIFW